METSALQKAACFLNAYRANDFWVFVSISEGTRSVKRHSEFASEIRLWFVWGFFSIPRMN